MGRTAATMALDSELPQRFSTRNKFGAPWLAELGIALVGVLLVLIDSFEFLIGLSSFAVLTYYAIANLAAFRQPREETSRPKWLNLFGLASCALLALAVPIASLSSGIAVLASLLLIRWGLAKRR
jgi:APA family basic amino acid/polyamine antiporter